jgi:hypothetical protein
MKIELLLFVILVLIINVGFIDVSYGHKAKVLDDFKIDVGWKTEPSIVGEKNAIEIIIELASDYDKQRYKQIFGDIIEESNSPSSKSDITGLEEKLEVIVNLAGSRTTLTLVEDSDNKGIYYGDYTPKEVGQPTINIFGTIKNIEFEASFKPEKVEMQDESPATDTQESKIPSWIKTNAGWWAEGQISDNDFVQAMQYLIKEGIITIPATEGEGSSDSSAGSSEIPSWIKTNAGWWAEGKITDNDFVQAMQYLITNGIIKIESS